MIVENHDSGDHAGSNHEHDAVEIGPEIYMIMIGQLIRSVCYPIRGVLLVTGNISPTIVLNKTIANNRLTPEILNFLKLIK